MDTDIYEDKTIKILISLYHWIEENCYNDDTIKVILCKLQCEINKQRNLLREEKKNVR